MSISANSREKGLSVAGATVDDLARGYGGASRGEDGHTCLFCQHWSQGKVEAEEHLHRAHGGALESLLSLGKSTTGLTSAQEDLIRLWLCGAGDRYISRAMETSESTVRGYRMRLRRRFQEARVLCALEKLLDDPGSEDCRSYLRRMWLEGRSSERLRACRYLLAIWPKDSGIDIDEIGRVAIGQTEAGTPELRGLAMQVLRRIDPKIGLSVAEDRLSTDESAWVRQEAAKTVRALAGKSGLRALSAAVRTDKSVGVRAAALVALSNLQSLETSRVREVLAEVAATDAHSRIREAASKALERIDAGEGAAITAKGLPVERSPISS